MLKGKSADFRTLILLKFTKKIIESTNSYGMYKLEKMLSPDAYKERLDEIKNKKLTQKEIKEQLKKEIKEKISSKEEYSASKKINESNVFVPVEREKESYGISEKIKKVPIPGQQKMIQRGMIPQGRIPPQQRLPPQKKPMPRPAPISHQDDLPEHLRYLRPTVSENPVEIDLGKLNPFLADPHVKTIETEGPDSMINVTGSMGKKPIGIKYTKEEIDSVIDKFSKEAKIPKTEGLFKVSYGNLILIAMISESLGSRFVIKKL